jgi:hypothetical protein
VVRVLLYAIPVILGVWAIVDCAQTRAEDVRALPRALWVAVIAFVPVVGPVLWLTTGRRRGGRPAGGSRPVPRPTAPDDDPDFLRGIDEQARRRAREQRDARAKDDHPETDDQREP